MFSMHLPSKMEVWQVSACPLPAHSGLPASARRSSLRSYSCSHQIWTLSSSWFIPEPNLCLGHATQLGPISPATRDFSKATCNSPSIRRALLSLAPRDDPALLSQGSQTKGGSGNGEASPDSAVCSFLLKREDTPLLCGFWGGKKRKNWLEPPVEGSPPTPAGTGV